MRLRVDIDGLDQLEKTFDGIHDRSTHLRPAFEAIGDDFRDLMGRIFSTRGLAVGGWQGLTPKYAARKRRARPNAPPGVFDGVLRRSLTVEGARYARQRIEEHAITLGTRAPHAHLFHDGRRRQRARRLIPRRDQMRQRWAPIVADHVAGRMTSQRRAGFV